jgi:hypothetical protein
LTASSKPLRLSIAGKSLLLGNVALIAPAVRGTFVVMTHPMLRWSATTEYRAPYLFILFATALISIAWTWFGSRRAANWMIVLFSAFVAVCIWDSSMQASKAEHLGIYMNELTPTAWLAISYGFITLAWLGLNIWYFYGRWDMVARTE